MNASEGSVRPALSACCCWQGRRLSSGRGAAPGGAGRGSGGFGWPSGSIFLVLTLKMNPDVEAPRPCRTASETDTGNPPRVFLHTALVWSKSA